MTRDESVELQELSLELRTNLLEMKWLLSLSSSENSIRSEEGRGGQKMLPELLNNKIQTMHILYLRQKALFSANKTGM